MAEIIETSPIAGVKLVRLHPCADERGSFMETFRREWFPERDWQKVQMNCSRSRAGVLRGLHYHRRQVDYWYVVEGTIRAGLVDLRQGSPTRGVAQAVDIHHGNPLGLLIPTGVAHGFLALSDVTLIYLVDNYYDANDEYGVAWNDPALGVDWNLGGALPLVSNRDRTNPPLRDIHPDHMPEWQR